MAISRLQVALGLFVASAAGITARTALHMSLPRCGCAGSMRGPWVAILELHGVFERRGGERFREDTPLPQGSGIKVCRRLQKVA